MDHILTSYTQHSGDPYSVARELGLTPANVMDHVRSVESRPIDGIHFVVPTRERPAFENKGRLRVVSVRHRDDAGWPVQDRRAIERAREQYDAGLIEMVQGRQSPWVIQYAATRRRPNPKREPWFSRVLGFSG